MIGLTDFCFTNDSSHPALALRRRLVFLTMLSFGRKLHGVLLRDLKREIVTSKSQIVFQFMIR
jgi:hypothetical protein